MTDQQIPIKSKFNARSTADDVLESVSLLGKRVLITGGHSGLGFESTKAFANAGAEVFIGARNQDAAAQVVAEIKNVRVGHLDLTDLESVRVFSEKLLNADKKFDIVINSAGIMACPETRVGKNWEAQFAVNHLGHFALVNRLRPLLKQGSRIISVSSLGHHASPMRWDDVQFTRGYDKWKAYGQSKTANALFAVQLSKLGKKDGIFAYSLHPGKIFTPLQRFLERDEMVQAGWMHDDGSPADATFKSPAQGAATQVWAGTEPGLEKFSGVYCEDCNIARIAETAEAEGGVCRYALDEHEAKRLWTLSAELTALDAF